MNTKLFIRIAVGVVIVGVFGWLIKSGLTSSSSVATPTPVAGNTTPLPIAYTSASADWQVYASASAGFKVSYPKDWMQESCGEGCVAFGAKDSVTPVIGITVTPGTLADTLTQIATYQVSKDDVSVGTMKWTNVALRDPQSGGLFISHFIQHGTKLFGIGLAVQDEATVAIYGQMIRSFVFTK